MNKPAQTPTPDSNAPQRIGDILRNARKARGITVETLARELRLNERYIQALESSDYDQLPGDTYIRVYLRSLCVFLSLPPEDILKRFFDERGLTGVDTLRKDSSTKINLTAVPEKKQPSPILYIILALIAALIAFSFIANNQGWFSPHPDTDEAAHPSAQNSAVASHDSAVPEPVVPEVIPRTKVQQKKAVGDSMSAKTAAVKPRVDSAASHKKTVMAKPGSDSLTVAPKRTADSAAHKTALSKDTATMVKTSDVKSSKKDTVKTNVKPAKDTLVQKPVGEKAKKDSAATVKPALKDSVKTGNVKQKKDSIGGNPPAIKDTAKPTHSPQKPKNDSIKAVPGDSAKLKVKSAPKDSSTKATKPASVDSAKAKAKPVQKDSATKATNPAPRDSAKPKEKSPPPDTGRTAQGTASPAKAMKLRVTASNDSTWVTVYRDGIRSKNMFRKGRSMYFIARDSFNLAIDAIENADVTLDGAPLSIPGTGKISVKVDAGGKITPWSAEQ